MDQTYQLFVYAIVALTVIGFVYIIYLNLFAPEPFVNELKRGLEVANSQEYLGKYYFINHKIIPEGTIVTKDFFDTQTMSIAIECTSEDKCCPKGELCSKNIEWDYDKINFKKDVSADVSVRCIRYEGVPVCRFYFVDLPAQSKINSVELIEQNYKEAAVTIEVKNDGKQKLTIGKLEVILYKNVNGKWVDTESDFIPREIDFLDPNKSHRFLWDFYFQTTGKYLAEFSFEGSNSGYDKKQIEIDINSENNPCSIDTERVKTIIDPISENFMEFHYCNNCSTAHDCLSAWNNANEGTEFELFDKESVYCIKNTYEGVCG